MPLMSTSVAQRDSQHQRPQQTRRIQPPPRLYLQVGQPPRQRPSQRAAKPEPQTRPRHTSRGQRRRLTLACRQQPTSAVIGAAVQGAVAAALASHCDRAATDARPSRGEMADNESEPEARQPSPLRSVMSRGGATGTARRRSEERSASAGDPGGAARHHHATRPGQRSHSPEPAAQPTTEQRSCGGCEVGRCGTCRCSGCALTQRRERCADCASAQRCHWGTGLCSRQLTQHQQCCPPAYAPGRTPKCCQLQRPHCQTMPHRGCLACTVELQQRQAGCCMTPPPQNHACWHDCM